MQRKQRAKHCFVPGCKTGYRSAKQTYTLFAVPQDPVRFEEWNRMIPRADMPLQAHSAVCERHFDERFVVRYYADVPVVNGVAAPMKRQRPALTNDAVPTVFPNLPKYLTRKLPIARKKRPRDQDIPVPSKRIKASEANSGRETLDEYVLAASDMDTEQSQDMITTHLASICLPSAQWTLLNCDTCIGFALLTLSNTVTDVRAERLVTVPKNPESLADKVTCTVSVNGSFFEEKTMKSRDELVEYLKHVDGLRICQGAGLVTEFAPLEINSSRTLRLHDGCVCSANCKVIVRSDGKCYKMRHVVVGFKFKRSACFERVYSLASDLLFNVHIIKLQLVCRSLMLTLQVCT